MKRGCPIVDTQRQGGQFLPTLSPRVDNGAAPFQRLQRVRVGRALIPPPPLPPSIFIGTERGNLETADRDWNKLEPAFMQTLLEIFARMEARGYPLALVEGYRSPDRQDQLAQGEQKITNARAFHSMHQFGLAADVAPIRNGKIAFNLGDAWTKAAYLALGEEASSSKLIWGGAWALQDYGHIQSRKQK